MGNHATVLHRVLEQRLDALEQALRSADVAAARRHVQAAKVLLGLDVDEAVVVRDGVALTSREEATLALLCDGAMSQKDIALTLGITHNTVKTHLRSLYLKLGVHSRAEAVWWARRCEFGGSVASPPLAG